MRTARFCTLHCTRSLACRRLQKAAIQLVSTIAIMEESSEGRMGDKLSPAEEYDNLLMVPVSLGTKVGLFMLVLSTMRLPDRSLSSVKSLEVEQLEDG